MCASLYPQGSRAREFSGSSTAAAERERPEMACRELENRSVKHSGWKNSKRLRRSLRLGSTEDEEAGELPLTSMTPISQIPVPGSGVRQGKLRRSLKKAVSDDNTSNTEKTGSPVSTEEVKDKQRSASRGRTEKKNKLTTSFPRRQWSWRSKKSDFNNYYELSPHKDDHSHQRSCSGLGDGGQLSSHRSSQENTTIAKGHNEETSPSIMHSVADSWSSPTPNCAFSKHTSM